MSQTKAYTRGVAARESTNAAMVSTARAAKKFLSIFGDSVKGFVRGSKAAPRKPTKRKPRAKK